MANGCFHVGTSGWSYKEWKGVFYPAGLAAGLYLSAYAKRFDAVEANSTAYGLPTPATVERWRATLPEGFALAVKAPQSVTHVLRLRGCGPALQEFVARIAPLDGRLGPILFQLPPSLRADVGLLRGFLAEARAAAGDRVLACEFRDPSWYREDVFAALREASVACCLHDMAGSAFATVTDGPILYLRRHGTAGRYAGSYGVQRLTADAEAVAAWLATGRDAYAFFNNTMHGEAIADAETLRGLVDERIGGRQAAAAESRP